MVFGAIPIRCFSFFITVIFNSKVVRLDFGIKSFGVRSISKSFYGYRIPLEVSRVQAM